MEKGAIIKHDLDNAPLTGEWRYMKPEVDASKCIGCETCVPHCPDAVMEMRARTAAEMEKSSEDNKKKPVVSIDYDYCKGCGVCAAVCPVKAIIMKK